MLYRITFQPFHPPAGPAWCHERRPVSRPTHGHHQHHPLLPTAPVQPAASTHARGEDSVTVRWPWPVLLLWHHPPHGNGAQVCWESYLQHAYKECSNVQAGCWHSHTTSCWNASQQRAICAGLWWHGKIRGGSVVAQFNLGSDSTSGTQVVISRCCFCNVRVVCMMHHALGCCDTHVIKSFIRLSVLIYWNDLSPACLKYVDRGGMLHGLVKMRNWAVHCHQNSQCITHARQSCVIHYSDFGIMELANGTWPVWHIGHGMWH